VQRIAMAAAKALYNWIACWWRPGGSGCRGGDGRLGGCGGVTPAWSPSILRCGLAARSYGGLREPRPAKLEATVVAFETTRWMERARSAMNETRAAVERVLRRGLAAGSCRGLKKTRVKHDRQPLLG
jgi:hypothetical protein